MNDRDFEILRDYCIRLRRAFTCVQRLAAIPPAERAAPVTAMLEKLERDLARFTEHVQQRETVSWGSYERAARHEPNQYIVPPALESSAFPDAPVKKFDAAGNRILPSDASR